MSDVPQFGDYRRQFPARAPDLSRQRCSDEIADYSAHAEVLPLPLAPCANAVVGRPPLAPSPKGMNTYLWVVTTTEVLIALEEGALAQSLTLKSLKHSNLTGGADAHCGGELWFRDERAIWLTGASGRYQPRSLAELEAVADALRRAGYLVACAGWDDTRNAPNRRFLGDVEWK